MDRLIGEIFGRALVALIGAGINAAIQSNKSSSSVQQHSRTLDQSLLPRRQLSLAVVIASSTFTFGNDCKRLVSIAFQTSQTFPTMMVTYADASQYIRNELAKQYSNEYFHIIIGENHKFDFSIDNSQYYAKIEQDRYRVLIFSTKQNSNTKFDTHNANSQILFVWN